MPNGPILSIPELVQKVRAHALANYEKGGWDIMIECHTEAEIATWIGKAMTEEQAIRKVARESGIKIVNSRRRDVQAEIF